MVRVAIYLLMIAVPLTDRATLWLLGNLCATIYQNGKTALMWAAANSRSQIVNVLLGAEGIDVNAQDLVRCLLIKHGMVHFSAYFSY